MPFVNHPDFMNMNYGALQTPNDAGVNPKLDSDTGGFNPYIQGIGAAKDLGNLYLGFQSLKLGKKQFKQNRNAFNTNLANQSRLINNQMEERKRVSLLQGGGYGGQEGQTKLATDLESYLAPRRVSGAPI